MKVHTKKYENHRRDKRQWKVDDKKIYNLVPQLCDQVLKEELKTLYKWR